jgi:hypothetical protein
MTPAPHGDVRIANWQAVQFRLGDGGAQVPIARAQVEP